MDETQKENTPTSVPNEAKEATEATSARSAIRTLQSDIAETVQQKSLSIADIAVAQKKKDLAQEFATPEEGHEKWSRRLLEVGAAVLVLAGLGALAFGIVMMQNDTPAPYMDTSRGVISVDSVVTKDITGNPRSVVIETVNEFMKDPAAPLASIRSLVLIRAQLGTTTEPALVAFPEFVAIVQTRAPGRLIRSLADDMTLGAVQNIPFIAIQTTSYETAFEGMLEWEDMMYADLPFIAKEIPRPDVPLPDLTPVGTTAPLPVATSTPAATSTATTTPPVEFIPPVWRDVVIQNKDARALMSADGEMFLIYAFPRPNMLVITQSKDALISLFDRIAAPTFSN